MKYNDAVYDTIIFFSYFRSMHVTNVSSYSFVYVFLTYAFLDFKNLFLRFCFDKLEF